jgi:hypothetical protein
MSCMKPPICQTCSEDISDERAANAAALGYPPMFCSVRCGQVMAKRRHYLKHKDRLIEEQTERNQAARKAAKKATKKI